MTRTLNESLWHRKYIFIAWCDPKLWNQDVWVRKINGRWQYSMTIEAEEAEREMQVW